jgi:hypothetical protein
VRVSAPNQGNGRGKIPQEGEGVLSNLPRTRPQRSSARRTAARKAAAPPSGAQTAPAARNARGDATRNGAAGTAANGVPAKAKRAPASSARPKAKGTASSARRARSVPRRPPAETPNTDQQVPRQGFESDSDRARGPVQPPGGAELVAGAVEIVGELAKAGFSTGERLLKDVLSRLPLS